MEDGVKESPATALVHEFGHAYDRRQLLLATGNIRAMMGQNQPKDDEFDNLWDRRAITRDEQKMAEANGEVKRGQPVRKNHDVGLIYQTTSPVSTKPAGVRIISVDVELLINTMVKKK